MNRALVACLVLMLACSMPAPEPDTPEEGGQGIRVVRMAPEPVLYLGALDGSVEEQFSDVRGAVRLTDGRIVVAEASTQELRVFAATGEPLGSWGRRGEGPGEFRGIEEIFLLPGDTVAVYDLAARRYSLFNASGEFLDTSQPRSAIEYTAGFLNSGLLATYQDFPVGSVGVVSGPAFSVVVQSFDGDTVRALGPFRSNAEYRVNRGRSHYGIRPLLAPRTHVAAGPRGVYVGDGGTPDIVLHATTGESVDTLTLPFTRRATVVPEDVDAFVDRFAPLVDSVTEWRRVHVQMTEELPVPDSLPWFDDLALDRHDRVWVREYPAPEQVDHRWWGLGTEDGSVVRVEVARELRRVFEVSENHVLGLSWGEFNEPIVLLYGPELDG